ncbi:hypothetical protein FF38_00219 [Lucilia cuprina]|uniref:Uncharacterized protein n=1 Tax=Lucilia cuprina TaxID=7375 RepID=A0A0L0C834_LUCCU|nr:hypothetical protein FF38_00219 [Lucilia cuprina]
MSIITDTVRVLQIKIVKDQRIMTEKSVNRKTILPNASSIHERLHLIADIVSTLADIIFGGFFILQNFADNF